MKNGHCVKCQAPTVYEVETAVYSNRGIVLSTWTEAGVTYYICTTCGYTEGYVLDQKKRAKITETKRHIEPRS
jgi:hypothetical protein